jgi:glycosyltransferase involved in cell wall biosynthesis
MATKVIDLEIQRLPPDVGGLDGYQQAMILFRYAGTPAGRAWAQVGNGVLSQAEIQRALLEVAGWVLGEQMLFGFLKYENAPVSAPCPATVAICTRDRPEDVQRCLRGLAKLPDDGQEILVVDNCPSTEATKRIAAEYPERVRYVVEEIPGLNRARNRALIEARHPIVAFTDDDTVPDPGWLRALARNFTDPLVLGVSGLTMPLELETEAQEWFERYSPFCRGFERRVYDKSNIHPLSAGRIGAGANMAIRKEAWHRVGPFDPALDAGTPTRSGGDTEMYARILTRGYRLVYDPAALNWHRHRRTWSELRQAVYGYGVGSYAYFTRELLGEMELSVLLILFQWFRLEQFPKLIRSIFHLKDSAPLPLVLDELRGCLAGPGAYLAARRKSLEPLRVSGLGKGTLSAR